MPFSPLVVNWAFSPSQNMSGQKLDKTYPSSVCFMFVFSFKAQRQLTVTVCQDGFKFIVIFYVEFCSFCSKCDNFTFHTHVCNLIQYANVCNKIPLFPRKYKKDV